MYASGDNDGGVSEKVMNTSNGDTGKPHNQAMEGLLTLLGGSGVSTHLYVLTTNNEGEVSDAFRSRPQRVRYFIKYSGLPRDVATEYLEDNLLDKSLAGEVMRCIENLYRPNFDILQALVQEVNTFCPENSMDDVLAIMNIDQFRCQPYEVKYQGVYPTWKDGGSMVPVTGVLMCSDHMYRSNLNADMQKKLYLADHKGNTHTVATNGRWTKHSDGHWSCQASIMDESVTDTSGLTGVMVAIPLARFNEDAF